MSRGGSREAVERRLLHLLHGRKTRTKVAEIHAHFLRHHLDHSNQLISHFVSVCGSLNKMKYANLVFQQFQCPNILLFNTMIKGYSLHAPFENSLQLFTAMKTRGIWPDEFTLAPLLKVCTNLGDLSLGQGVQKECLVLGFHRYLSVGIGLVEMYTSCERMGDAKKVFDEMPHRDVIVWNLMVRGYCRSGNVETGFQMFRQMDERNVVSWNTMISCLSQNGRDREALRLFDEMRRNGEPDEVTVVTTLPVCSRLGEVEVGRWIHSFADSKSYSKDYVSVNNALVDFYCKCGVLDSAFKVFRSTAKKTVVSWNAMISGLALNGKGELGVSLFDEMVKDTNVRPNESTFVGVLACCVHAGLLQKGREVFSEMSVKYSVRPRNEHYGCMVDLLGRGGCLKEAFDLLQTMPLKPNSALWGALLSACRTHGDSELAECAAKELVNLEPWNSGNYVLLSNVYAERGEWDEVDKVRTSMRENCVQKAAGQSLVA